MMVNNMKYTGQHDSYGSWVRGIFTFAVYFSVFRTFCRFTLVYEVHFVLCCEEKIELLDRAMADIKRS